MLQQGVFSVSNLTHYVRFHPLPSRDFSLCYCVRTLRVSCSAGTGVNRYGRVFMSRSYDVTPQGGRGSPVEAILRLYVTRRLALQAERCSTYKGEKMHNNSRARGLLSLLISPFIS